MWKSALIFCITMVGIAMQAQEKNVVKSSPAAKVSANGFPDAAHLKQMIARFALTPLEVNVSGLSAGDKQALSKLIEASRVINDIFLTQLWSGNHAELAKLEKDSSSLGRERLHYFWINKSPWSDLDGHTAFLPGVPPKKLPGANFYPANMSKEQFESWVKTLPQSQREQAEGFFTVIRRGPQHKLTIVPYSTEYRSDLQKAAGLLKEAAALTDNDSLKQFLIMRADAFLSNDYYQSDLAWMD